MSRTHIPEAVRRRVADAAGRRCGYCQAQQQIVGYPLQIDHIVPDVAGGPSHEENLWLACCACNNAKGAQTHGIDPVSRSEVRLFNPRTQAWSSHFAWSEDGTCVLGLTAVGWATVTALDLNAPFRVHSRERWVLAGWHPPRTR